MLKSQDLKVALVHDFLVQYGGAERVLEVLCEMFPQAPIYTLLYNEEKMRGKFAGKDIRTSYLQKFPRFLRRHYQWLLPFCAVVPETFDLREYDLVISSSGAWSKGIVTKLNTIHFAYIHSPMRFAWDYNERYMEEEGRSRQGFFARPVLSYLRLWDRLAAERPDYLIANSKYTQERIKKYYRRESKVIYPPAYNETLAGKTAANKKNYFLIVSRLSAYKKVDLAVKAFNKLELPLVVIGEGKQKKYLQKIAEKNVRILGWRDEKDIAEFYKNARAFIFPSEDDFGMTMVEAMSWGVPVIAFRAGGACEVIEEGITGEFFDSQTPEVLADGVRRFIEKENTYDAERLHNRARQFSKEKFKQELKEYIDSVVQKL